MRNVRPWVKQRIFPFLAAVVFAGLILAGCDKKQRSSEPPVGQVSHSSHASQAIPLSSHQGTTSLQATETGKIPGVSLEKAMKDYLDAYEKYVKMLRESGPQTMDTLHALSDYQKKYRFYQTLLDAQRSGS